MTALMGIMNLTPDSFSDGGAVGDCGARIAELIAHGAQVIDVGAESTRPGATPVSAEEEAARLEPFFAVLPRFRGQVEFSVDTRHAATVARALAEGVEWINDVSGLHDAAIRAAVRDSACRLVVMHSLSVPADTGLTLAEDVDPVAEILAWAEDRKAALAADGIASDRLVLDPGIGFGKTAEQSLALLARVEELRASRLPLLIGHSRKSFLKAYGEREAATLTVSAFLAMQEVEFLRVHDVAAHAEMLRSLGELRG